MGRDKLGPLCMRAAEWSLQAASQEAEGDAGTRHWELPTLLPRGCVKIPHRVLPMQGSGCVCTGTEACLDRRTR